MASFSAITIDTFLSPFSMLGMYVLSMSAFRASFSCDNPFSNRRRFKLLPNFCLMSIVQKSLFVESCTTDNHQHNNFLRKNFGLWVGLVCLIFFVLVNVSTVVFRMTDNGLQLGEVAEIEAQMFSFAQKFNRRTELEFSTEPAILPNCCYLLCCFWLHIFYYEFNYFVFTLLDKFFRPSRTFSRHFLNFTLLFQMVVTIAFVGKWFVTN